MSLTRSRRPALSFALAIAVTALVACPNDPTESDDLGWINADGGAAEGRVVTLDATGETTWTYLSFAAGVVATPDKPEESLDWDLAFQRYNMKTNGGSSGKGQGAVSDLGALDLKTTTTATVSKWTADAVIEDARTGDKKSMNAVLSGWYSYHFFKHELVSNYSLYAVRAADGRVALVKVHDYYDAAGTAGHFTVVFRFPIGAETTDGGSGEDGGSDAGTPEILPDSITEEGGLVRGETNFDARAGVAHFSFAERGAVLSTAPWDLAFDTWILKTNSGTSGTEGGGAQAAGTTDFAAATTCPDNAWRVDTEESIGAEQRVESTNLELAGWFDYDPTTQKIRSKGDVYWIRSHDGKVGKLQVVGYYHPDGSSAFYRLRWAFRTDGGRTF